MKKIWKWGFIFVAVPLLFSGCQKPAEQESSSEIETLEATTPATSATEEETESSAEESSTEETGTEQQAGSSMSGLNLLAEGQSYSYDLDGDGTEETIRYQLNENDEGYSQVELYINDTLCDLGGELYGYSASVYVTDLNEEDQLGEICINTTVEAGGLQALSFFRYAGGNVELIDNLAQRNVIGGAGEFSHGEISEIREDGTIVTIIDTPVHALEFGCYYVEVLFRLEGSELVEQQQDQYPFVPHDMGEWPGYVVKTEFTAVTEPGGDAPAFTAAAGETVELNGLCIRDGQIYGRVTNSEGISGWLPNREGLSPNDDGSHFVEVPAWG